ncbi:general substrate transporter [Patellaria atrata CBS 101060]|uniref:General substrate transporter n=1 Tax=Patellaria atrata CBS 101060 TaxID=1346257 RepID=A0A9P4VSU0_9PEZI|nr:general substrate transporter [Patellaria atrata CBS 101060]
MGQQLVTKGLLPSRGTLRLTGICMFFALAALVWGYNIGIMAIIYVHPGFKAELNQPSASKKGLITAIYYLGTWTSYNFIAHPTIDRLGRRYAAGAGVFVTCIGAALQAGAKAPGALAMMIIGRIICGLGLAVVSSSVPMYQSEISPAKHRGRFVVLNHVGMIAGLAGAFWVGYGMSHWETPRGNSVGWRVAVCVQYIPAVIFLVGLPFCPETPRWLIQKGRIEEARASLELIRADNGPLVKNEIDEIIVDTEAHRVATSQSITVLFTNRPMFNRLWRTALLHFMAQMCGNTAMKYYLPTIFMSLGLSHKISLMIGGIETTLKIGCTIIDMLLIDKFGRRLTLLGGIMLMILALLLNGVLPLAYPDNVNAAADWTCIIFIFFYTFGYSVSLGPAPWVYGAEIFPTNFRARGLNIAASGGAIGSIIASQTWPVGMDNIGSKTYLIFFCFNVVTFVIILFFYPETKRRPLEDMDVLFGGNVRDRHDAERASDEHGEVDEQVVQPKTSRT